jgi:hypothetical protein
MSIRVWIGVATGMPLRRVVSMLLRRCTFRPLTRGFLSIGTDISIIRIRAFRMPQRIAAVSWLSTARSPQARTAAMK